jgi:hypothetical protein
MPGRPLWLVIHVFLFVYWLGADLGVYYASKFVLRKEFSNETRMTVEKIVEAIDLSPRVCLVLILPSGVSLMATQPHHVSWLNWQLALVTWAFSFFWLYLVVTGYRSHGKIEWMRKLDLYIRYALIVTLIGTGLYALFAREPFGVTSNPKWLAGKIIVYGIAIAGGVGIRRTLVPFAAAFNSVMQKGSTPESEAELSRSMAKALPYVHLIWTCVAIAAILGIVKPGMRTQ